MTLKLAVARSRIARPSSQAEQGFELRLECLSPWLIPDWPQILSTGVAIAEERGNDGSPKGQDPKRGLIYDSA